MKISEMIYEVDYRCKKKHLSPIATAVIESDALYLCDRFRVAFWQWASGLFHIVNSTS